jgi:serine/threonine-protein kinase SRPK3
VLRHIAAASTTHEGALFVRILEDYFEVEGPSGVYQCLVHEPLVANLFEYRSLLGIRRLPEVLLQPIICSVLAGLNFLYSQAHVIYTGKFSRVEARKLQY